MSANNYKDLLQHVGHDVQVVIYGGEEDGVRNVAVECHDCYEIIMDFDVPDDEFEPLPPGFYDDDNTAALLDNHGNCEACGKPLDGCDPVMLDNGAIVHPGDCEHYFDGDDF